MGCCLSGLLLGPAVELGNCVWLTMAFRYFWMQRRLAAKLLVPPGDARKQHAYRALMEALPFLGGFNLTLAMLSACSLAHRVSGKGPLFTGHAAQSVVWATMAVAHGSQWAGNARMLLPPTSQQPLWPVLRGTMRFIFVVDGLMALLNALAALRSFSQQQQQQQQQQQRQRQRHT